MHLALEIMLTNLQNKSVIIFFEVVHKNIFMRKYVLLENQLLIPSFLYLYIHV